MSTLVTEIAPDVFRLSRSAADYGIQFIQLLVRGAEPFLVHAGFRRDSASIRVAVGEALDPASVRWTGVSHCESSAPSRSTCRTRRAPTRRSSDRPHSSRACSRRCTAPRSVAAAGARCASWLGFSRWLGKRR